MLPCSMYKPIDFGKDSDAHKLFSCRRLRLFLMALWILPRLTHQKTDTSIFTPVSETLIDASNCGILVAILQ